MHCTREPLGSRANAFVLAICFVLGGSACRRLHVPEGPDLTAIAAIYDEPTGMVSNENIEEAVNQAMMALSLVEELGSLGFVVETLKDVGEKVKTVAKQDDGSLFKVNAVSEVDSICPGSEPKASVREENGDLSFTLTVKNSSIEEVVWGEFVDCQIYQAGQGIVIDSSMDIYLGGRVPLNQLSLNSLLFQLVGEFRSSSKVTPLNLDFRLVDDTTEIRIPAANGDVIFRFAQRQKQVALQTREGSFCCDFSKNSCFQLGGRSCTDAETGDKVISW